MVSILASRTLRLGRLELRLNPLLVLCLVAALTGLVRLGLWQLERAGEQIRLQAEYEALREGEAVPIESLNFQGLARDRELLQNRRVLLEGEYLNGRSIYLIYQSYEDHPGYEVVTPLRLKSGQGLVLVSRGWSGIADVEELTRRLPEIRGPVSLSGQLHVPSDELAGKRNPPRRGEASWPLVARYLNLGELAPLFEEALFPYEVRLGADEPGVLVRHWPVVQVETDRHFSYALQWFAMAVALAAVGLILGSNLPQLWRAREHNDAKAQQP